MSKNRTFTIALKSLDKFGNCTIEAGDEDKVQVNVSYRHADSFRDLLTAIVGKKIEFDKTYTIVANNIWEDSEAQ